MRERSEMALKIVCGVLAALLLFQIGRMLFRASPLRGVRVPDLPALSVGSNQPPAKATNAIAGSVAVTNATNTVANAKPGKTTANTNEVQAAAKPETNAVLKSAEARTTNPTPTLVLTNSGTNVASNRATNQPPTNSVAGKPGTNVAPVRAAGKSGPPPAMMPGAMAKLPELSPLVQARVDRITQSELLAPFIRPLPMALLGIAGRDAFLRAPNGQTGLVKEGDELGGVKLLKIGINRVLIEQAGESKELMIFSGLGGESLLPKPNVATNETNPKIK